MTSTEIAANLEEQEKQPTGPQAYFLAIEKLFIELRGAPLLLSPSDWQICRAWHEQEIPLELVERTLLEIFERRRQQGKEDDKVQSLRYLKRAMESAWRRQQEIMAPAKPVPEPELNLARRLQGLALALPPALPDLSAFQARIKSLQGEMEEIEGQLSKLDGEILAALEQNLGDEARQDLSRELDESLEDLGRRLPRQELEAARHRLHEQVLRRHVQLPVLSLFSAPALAAEEEDPSGDVT